MGNQYENMGSSSHRIRPEDKEQNLKYTGGQDITHNPDGTVSNEKDPDEIRQAVDEGMH